MKLVVAVTTCLACLTLFSPAVCHTAVVLSHPFLGVSAICPSAQCMLSA